MLVNLRSLLQLIQHSQTCSRLKENVYAARLLILPGQYVLKLVTKGAHSCICTKDLIYWLCIGVHLPLEICVSNLNEQRGVIQDILRKDRVRVYLGSRVLRERERELEEIQRTFPSSTSPLLILATARRCLAFTSNGYLPGCTTPSSPAFPVLGGISGRSNSLSSSQTSQYRCSTRPCSQRMPWRMTSMAFSYSACQSKMSMRRESG